MDEVEVARDLCSIAAWMSLAEMDSAAALIEQAAGVLAARCAGDVYRASPTGIGQGCHPS
jgi:hypothetical protein